LGEVLYHAFRKERGRRWTRLGKPEDVSVGEKQVYRVEGKKNGRRLTV